MTYTWTIQRYRGFEIPEPSSCQVRGVRQHDPGFRVYKSCRQRIRHSVNCHSTGLVKKEKLQVSNNYVKYSSGKEKCHLLTDNQRHLFFSHWTYYIIAILTFTFTFRHDVIHTQALRLLQECYRKYQRGHMQERQCRMSILRSLCSQRQVVQT